MTGIELLLGIALGVAISCMIALVSLAGAPRKPKDLSSPRYQSTVRPTKEKV